MTNTIRLKTDGKLLVAFDKDFMRPGIELASRRLRCGVRHIAAEMLDNTFVRENDGLFACLPGTEAARSFARLFKRRMPRLPPGGYSITPAANGDGTLLLVVGGDRFGALCGISEALRWCRRADEGNSLIYTGGARREMPAFPLRFYWTWDHSTNWVLDDPGNQVNGCNNPYLKRPETFVEDYKRLIDHAVDMRFNAVVVCGFLRDSHGAEVFAHEVARYGADRGVAVLPGVGITSYDGIYYEGEHPANLPTFLSHNPTCAALDKDGRRTGNLSPYLADGREYIRSSLTWLARSFPVGGVYLENGDYIVDYSSAAKRARSRIPGKEEDFLKEQYVAYKCALDALHELCPQAWNVYATYCGFDMNAADRGFGNRGLDKEVPYFASRMPESAVCMWTLTGMLRKMPVPLRDWMEDAHPASVYDNPTWPRGLRPPSPRSAGFMHQGSQWASVPRTALAISSFAEGCLRSFESGLEGISIHGEATSRTMTWLLNYLSMRHWTYHPGSTLRDFALAELQPRLGGEEAALQFVEALCLLEEGRHDQAREIAGVHLGSGYSWRGRDRTLDSLEEQRMWMEMKWWACHPDSAVRMLPRISDLA